MNKLYLEDLEGLNEEQIIEHLCSEYEAETEELNKYIILVAYESVGSWGCDSSSFFLLKEKSTGEYFINHGSHCSCYGFEGQFEPEKTNLEYLKSTHFSMFTGGYDSNSDTNIRKVKEYIMNINEHIVEDNNETIPDSAMFESKKPQRKVIIIKDIE